MQHAAANDNKARVRMIHPDAILFIGYNGRCRIKRGREVISDICDKPEEAWASAAKRLGFEE